MIMIKMKVCVCSKTIIIICSQQLITTNNNIIKYVCPFEKNCDNQISKLSFLLCIRHINKFSRRPCLSGYSVYVSSKYQQTKL